MTQTYSGSFNVTNPHKLAQPHSHTTATPAQKTTKVSCKTYHHDTINMGVYSAHAGQPVQKPQRLHTLHNTRLAQPPLLLGAVAPYACMQEPLSVAARGCCCCCCCCHWPCMLWLLGLTQGCCCPPARCGCCYCCYCCCLLLLRQRCLVCCCCYCCL